MSPSELIQLGIGFLIASVTILVIQAGRKEVFWRKKNAAQLHEEAEEASRQRRIKEARLPKGRIAVQEPGQVKRVGRGLKGVLMVVAVGSYGQNMIVRLLNLLLLCGLDWLIGSILLIQHNAGEREAFKGHIHERYHSRIIYGYSPAWSGGLANQPTITVLQHSDQWAPPLRVAAREVAYWHEQWNQRPPGQILFFWSEGGQAPVGLPVVEELHQRFPEAQIVGMTSLPRHRRNRRKFAELKGAYERRGKIAGWVVNDELRPGWQTTDYCMVALVVAITDAQLYDDETTQLNNVLALLFTEYPGSVASLEYVAEEVVAYEWEVEGTKLGYFVEERRVVETIQRALRAIEDGRAMKAVDFPIGELDTSVFDVVMTNIGYDERHDRNDLEVIRDQVEAGYQERLAHLRQTGNRQAHPGLLYDLADYGLKFGSVATLINPSRPSCPIVAIRLATLKDGDSLSEELAAVPPELLPPFARPLALPDANNTHHEEEEEKNGSDESATGASNPGPRPRGRPRKHIAAS